jgi:glycosyltransferase involved in cell wall biosynthesis
MTRKFKHYLIISGSGIMRTVSVVIPCYNGERYLEECFASIRSQTHPPEEVILVNDASTDGSEKLAKSSGMCRVLSNSKNLGIGASRKRGSHEATGDYVVFLSHDDALHPDFLEKMLKQADSQSILYCDYYVCNEKLEPQRTFKAPRWQIQQQFRMLVIEWTLNHNLFVNFSCVMIPRWVFKKVQFDKNLRIGEDTVFLLECIKAGVSFKHVAKPLLYYRVHEQAGTRKGWHKEKWLKFWDRLAPLLLDLGVAKEQVNTAMRKDYQRRFGPWQEFKNHVPQSAKKVYRTLKSLWQNP